MALFRGSGRAQPTESSIRIISERLGFTLPSDFIAFANICPAYDAWFGSIGEDFESPVHILEVNAEFHSPDILLPAELIVINHGYDDDLDCYDLRKTEEESRYSICYC